MPTLFDNSWSALLRPGDATNFFLERCLRPFQSEAPAYSAVNAWWMAEICRVLYRRGPDEIGPLAHPVTRGHILRKVKLKEVRFIDKGTAHCALILSEIDPDRPFAILAFRGTTGFETWLSNLNTFQVPWMGEGLVHGGFKKEFYKLWYEVEDLLSELRCPVFYTGHSLGGALAVMAASLAPPRAVYTFGAPKAGDAVFANSLQRIRIYRLINNRDIVPTVPPSQIPFDFCHCGELLSFFNKNGHPKEAPSQPEESPSFPGALRQVTSQLRRRLLDPPDFLIDHAPVNYTAHLTEELLKTNEDV
ncbi:MAG: lipase family protein [Thermodesulfobacteriota bacterium]